MAPESTINNCLKNPFYCGKMMFKGQVYPGNQPQLISEELFERCQSIINEHNQSAVRTRKHQYLLRGFTWCATCGARIFAEPHTRGSVTHHYYFCGGKCGQPYAEIGQVEEDVIKLMSRIVLPQRIIGAAVTKAKEILEQTHDTVDRENDQVRKSLQSLDRRRDTLEIKLLEEVITNETYKRQSASISSERETLERQLIRTTDTRQRNIRAFERLLQLARDLPTAYREAPYAVKRQYLSLFFDRIEIDQKRAVKGIPSQLFRAITGHDEVLPDQSVRITTVWLALASALRTNWRLVVMFSAHLKRLESRI